MSDVNNLWTCLINLLKANLCGLINFGGQFGDLGGGEQPLRNLIHRLRTNTKPNGLKRVLLNANFGFYPADKDQIFFFCNTHTLHVYCWKSRFRKWLSYSCNISWLMALC